MKRIRDRRNPNMQCITCNGPITYEPNEMSHRRCKTCTVIHNRITDTRTQRTRRINAVLRDTKKWKSRMAKAAGLPPSRMF